jgi:hypothetical protein
MIDKEYEFKIYKDSDLDHYKKEFDKVDCIRLDLRNTKLSKDKFQELFERLTVTSHKLNALQIDISDFDRLDDDYISYMSMSIRSLNLKTFIFNFSECQLTDSQFECLVYDSLMAMTKLEKLYLFMENIKFDECKAKILEKLFSKLKGLEYLYMDLKKNKLEKDDIAMFEKCFAHVYTKEIIYE